MFLVGDWLLVLLLISFTCFGAAHLLGVSFNKASVSEAVVMPETAGTHGVLAQVKPRGDYDVIVSSGIFGAAGTQVQEALPPPPPQEEVKTPLKLKLCGTSATNPHDLFASAIILNEEKNQVGTFCVGQEVVEQVTLEEVYQRKVILMNKKLNRREVLQSEEDDKSPSSAAPAADASGPKFSAGSNANRVTLKKKELVKELMTNYTDLITQVKPELQKDDQNNVIGITASNLESIPLAQKLGVKDGDVLQTINNEKIDSEAKIVELVNKYRDSSTFRIGLMRDGKPVVVTYKLE
jgi:general secretion pathway protein C